jgi:hypothetical protein
MVIEKIFLPCATILIFLPFSQQPYPLCRQQDRSRWMTSYGTCWRLCANSSLCLADELHPHMGLFSLLLWFECIYVVARGYSFFILCLNLELCMDVHAVDLFIKYKEEEYMCRGKRKRRFDRMLNYTPSIFKYKMF